MVLLPALLLPGTAAVVVLLKTAPLFVRWTDAGCPSWIIWRTQQATHLSDGPFHAVEVLKSDEAKALDASFRITRDQDLLHSASAFKVRLHFLIRGGVGNVADENFGRSIGLLFKGVAARPFISTVWLITIPVAV